MKVIIFLIICTHSSNQNREAVADIGLRQLWVSYFKMRPLLLEINKIFFNNLFLKLLFTNFTFGWRGKEANY